jgi:transketolase
VPALPGTENAGALRGAYTLVDAEQLDVIIAASGSEVHVAIDAAKILATHEIGVRVVSMPCWSLFEEQGDDYREEVFPYSIPVIGVEAGVEMGWQAYADAFVGMRRFGASAPGEVLMEKFNFTASYVAEHVMELLAEVVAFREVVQRRMEEHEAEGADAGETP